MKWKTLSAALACTLLMSGCNACDNSEPIPRPRSSCADGIQNQGEQGIDCGGPCTQMCELPPTCSDDIKNQGEEDVDCGGPCPACQAGPTCSDGVQNQGEQGVDCGGPCAACQSNATCADGIQNQGEQGVDCGGPCAACPTQARCGDGVIQRDAGEQCDETPKSDCAYGRQSCMVCNDQCKLVAGRVTGFCGDGIVQSADGETCEPSTFQETSCANTTYGSTTCLANCTTSEESCFDVLSVHSGGKHTCAVITGGRVMCWGDNNFGQLGTPASDRISTKPALVPGLAGVTALGLGLDYSCALQAGSVLCWGNNNYGQLGDASTTARHEPRPVSNLSGVTDLWTGQVHTCAKIQGAGFMCWGNNGHGQIGNGGPPERQLQPSSYDAQAPRMVQDASSCVTLGLGSLSSYCVTSNGGGLAWGYNVGEGLGVGSLKTHENTPLPINGLSNTAQLIGGFRHSCSRLSNGTVSCWGYNDFGQAARPPVATAFQPALISGLTSIQNLTSGPDHVCALSSFGRVSCWGRNDIGQLGRGTASMDGLHTPEAISQLNFNMISAATSGAHTCGVSRDGQVYCWGSNASGQLGDGTTVDKYAPTPITF